MNNQKEDANVYLSKFAKLMRGILSYSRASTITLAEEIESLQLYLELETFVYNEQFTFNFSIDEQIDTEDVLIPSMILQPYIENAIIHGLAPVQQGGLINITFSKRNDLLICTIEDNGIGRKKAAELKQQKAWKNHPSLGMQVTQERIDLLSIREGKKINLEINDITDGGGKSLGTQVRIEFPFVPAI
jgi:sensor histidine kinase YesM